MNELQRVMLRAKPRHDLAGLRNQGFKVVDTMGKNLAMLCKSRKVEYVRSRATFQDGRSLRVDDGSQRTVVGPYRARVVDVTWKPAASRFRRP